MSDYPELRPLLLIAAASLYASLVVVILNLRQEVRELRQQLADRDTKEGS